MYPFDTPVIVGVSVLPQYDKEACTSKVPALLLPPEAVTASLVVSN